MFGFIAQCLSQKESGLKNDAVMTLSLYGFISREFFGIK
jgi:hypothetical protein